MLVASGQDALFDAVLSASVLASSLIFIFTGISLEAFVGVGIAIVIIKAGIDMISETVNDIIGARADRELVASIKRTVCEDPAVRGAYDLLLHNYGPETIVGSLHVEIPDTMTAEEIDAMERRIAATVMERHGILLTGTGIYTANTTNDEAKEIRTNVIRMVSRFDGVLQTHGFYADLEAKTINLDVILDFALPDREATFAEICKEVQDAYPDYTLNFTLDLDF